MLRINLPIFSPLPDWVAAEQIPSELIQCGPRCYVDGFNAEQDSVSTESKWNFYKKFKKIFKICQLWTSCEHFIVTRNAIRILVCKKTIECQAGKWPGWGQEVTRLRPGKWPGWGQAGQQLACVLDSHVTLPEVKDESNCAEIREFSSVFGPERSSSPHQPHTLTSDSRLLRQARYRLAIPISTSTCRSLKLHWISFT